MGRYRRERVRPLEGREGGAIVELHPDIEKVVLSEDQIAEIVAGLGAQITRDYADKNPLVICVLKGAAIVTADLVRQIKTPITMDFMAVSSYGDGTTSSGVVRILKDLDTRIEGRHVIIVEDILDSGLTLSYLIRLLKSRNPASVAVAAFLVKELEDRESPVSPHYVGAHVPNEFLVGYGLDYAERYRNLPYIGVLKPECYL